MKKITFYFDMDGTLADLYSVKNWEPMLRAECARPYAEAAPLVDCEKLQAAISFLKKEGYSFGVVSWASKGASKEYRKEIRKTKVAWLKKYFPDCFDEIHVVKYGTPKHWVVKNWGILFDDEKKNRERWSKGRAFSEKSIFEVLEW